MGKLLLFVALSLFCVNAFAQSACVAPPPGIVDCWTLDETSGSIATDTVGNHPAVYINGPIQVPGKVQGALAFSGSNYLSAQDSDIWAFGTSDFTIELWARFDASPGGSVGRPGATFIGDDEGSGNRNKWFFCTGGGYLYFHINGPSIGAKFFPLVQFSPNVGAWYHLAVVRSGSTYTIFVNGAPAGSATNSDAVPNANAPLTIGQAEGLGFMRGALDEISVYDRALAPEELKSIYDAGSAGKCLRRAVYVSASNGADTNGGLSWGTAKKTVQAGIDAASTGDDVWVAAGTYTPTSGSDRSASVVLKPGVGVYGGFAGMETAREQRNWLANATIISGDIGIPGDSSDNSYHAVIGSNDSVLDGFTITGGNANGTTPSQRVGGGIYNDCANPRIESCIILQNAAAYNGGGMYNASSSPTIEGCQFLRNQASYDGGAMCNSTSNPSVTACVFNGNSAPWGAAIYDSSSSPLVANCVFSGNVGRYGGGLYHDYGTPNIVNCTFSANAVSHAGGAIYTYSGAPTLTNCILWGNSAFAGSQISSYSGANPVLAFCDVQGGWSGIGNMPDDPQLVLNPQPGLDGLWGTADDDYGDLRLRTTSRCINAGTNGAVGLPDSDIDGQPRIANGVVDMGAHEYSGTVFVDTPQFQPDGGTYDVEQHVVVTCLTPGSVIHYTTNGQDPVETDPVIAYPASVYIDHNLTLKARAWSPGLDPSAIMTARYELVVATPEFSPAGGLYGSPQSVSIVCATPGATIHYTLDGDDPTEADPVVASDQKVAVDHSLTLKARSWKDGFTPSAIATDTYVIQPPPCEPSGSNPIDSASGVGSDVVLTWQSSCGAQTYEVYLWPASSSEPSAPTVSGLTVPGYKPKTVLTHGTLYKWRVVARNAVGSTAGPTWAFTTESSPDLSISQVAAPASAYAGQTITVHWRTANSGTVWTGYSHWQDQVFLSVDQTPDSSDWWLNEVPNSSYLMPGESYESSINVTIPKHITGTYYVIVRADSGNAVAEEDESNNQRYTAVAVTIPDPPDLQVTSVNASENGWSGQPVSVSWTVENKGKGGVPIEEASWTDAVYLSTDNSFDPASDRLLGTFAHSGVLGPNQNYPIQNASVNLPVGVWGDFYVFVVTDQANNVFEYAWESNNAKCDATPLHINLTPPPDLIVSSVDAPANAPAGSTIPVSWTVTNQGPGGTVGTSWNDAVYLSDDEVLTPSADTLLGRVAHSGELGAGLNYTETANFGLPRCVSANYHVYVVTDSENSVFEYDPSRNAETNNEGHDPVPVVVSSSPPDLAVASVSCPAQATAGGPIEVDWTVVNSGIAVTTAASWSDAVYLSANDTMDSSDTLLGSVAHSGQLQPISRYSQRASFTLPVCAQGTYYIFVCTDRSGSVSECDEANNCARSESPVQLTANLPDLLPVVVEGSQQGAAGQPVTVNWTVTNEGNAGTGVSAWNDRVYLSPTQSFNTATAISLGVLPHSGALASAGSYSASLTANLPPRVYGDYYFVVNADTNDSVEECSAEGNNMLASSLPIHVAATAADLQVTSLQAPDTALDGTQIAVSWAVGNFGTLAACSPSTDTLYLSRDASLNKTEDVLLGKVIRSQDCGVGASYDTGLQATIPYGSYGAFFLIALTDDGNAVFEAEDEGNNTRSRAIHVNASPYADLLASSVNAPNSAYIGQSFQVTWQVGNAMSVQTNASGWTDYVYISRDQVLDAWDTKIGYLTHSGPLAGSGSYSASCSVASPAGAYGQYYVFVKADGSGQVLEGNENNNAAFDPVPIDLQPQPPADLTVTSVTSPANGTVGQTIALSWTVTNIAQNPATGQWYDSVYLSTDSSWDSDDALVASVPHTGPVGGSYTGSINADVPGVVPGSYYVIVRSDIRNNVRESDETNNVGVSSSTFDIGIEELKLGVSSTGQMSTGTERQYRVYVSAGEDLRVTLHCDSPTAATELYVRYGAPADRGNYDFIYDRPLEPDQVITVPTTQEGWYYVLVRGASVQGATVGYSISATLAQFGITSVHPNHGGNSGTVFFKVSGARFEYGATIRLRSGSGSVVGEQPKCQNSGSVTAFLDLRSAVPGSYDVVVVNPDGSEAVSDAAFEVVAAEEPTVILDALVPTSIRAGGVGTAVVYCANTGLADIGKVIIEVNIQGAMLDSSCQGAFEEVVPFSETKLYFVTHRIGVGDATSCPIRVRPNGSEPVRLSLRCAVGSAMSAQPANQVYPSLAPRPSVLSASAYMSVAYRAWRGYRVSTAGFYPPGDLPDGAVLYNTGPTGHVAVLVKINGHYYVGENLIGNKQIPYPENGTRMTQWGDYWWRNRNEEIRIVPTDLDATQLEKLKTWLKNNSWPWGTPKGYNPFYKCTEYLLEAFRNGAGKELLSSDDPLITPTEIYERLTGEPAPGGPLSKFKDKYLPWSPWNPDLPIFGPYGVPYYIPVVWPRDPNEKTGPDGFGSEAFVGNAQTMPYTVYFENVSSATAPAQTVRVTDQLDSDLDPRTFRLGQIVFGDHTVDVPDNRSYFQTRIDLGPEHGGISADITAGLDVPNNRVFWTVKAVDPLTGESPEDPTLGLLPPNDDTHRGEGYVTYTIKPKAGLATGTLISNSATITFDNNEPIETNTVTNTIDGIAPNSAVNALPATSTASFVVSWSGGDDSGGSGLKDYDVYAQDGGAQPTKWLSEVTYNDAVFTGKAGHTYSFYTVARDNAGNLELAPSGPDAETSVPAEPENPGSAKCWSDGDTVNVSGPDGAGITTTAVFSDCIYVEAEDRSSGIRVTNVTGVAIQPGDRIKVVGVLRTSADGERYVEAVSSEKVSGTQVILDPLGMPNRGIGGGNFNYDVTTGQGQRGVTGGTGLNNIGLLVSTWGEVTYAEAGFFYVDDRSGAVDGSGHLGVKVLAPGTSVPSSGNYVRVTGISSCFSSGASVCRLLLVRSQTDISVVMAQAVNISNAKMLADSLIVNTLPSVVSSVFPGFFYAESPDRASGIRIDWNGAIAQYELVEVTGTLRTNAEFERYIQASEVTPKGTKSVFPLGMANASISGSDCFYSLLTGAGQRGAKAWRWVKENPTDAPVRRLLDVYGLNNIGLLITTWGKVVWTGDGCFTIDDGTNYDSTEGQEPPGVKVFVPVGVALPSMNSFVCVTGISSCYRLGDAAYQALRVWRASDVRVLAVQ